VTINGNHLAGNFSAASEACGFAARKLSILSADAGGTT